MIYNAKNGSIKVGKTEMDYISFGSGKRILVMIPGLGDGLRQAKGTEVPLALIYHEAAKDFTVYVFSRRKAMQPGFSTRDMAEDVYIAMQRLGILRASVIGISQGGMIAQYLALDHPEVIKKLVLAVTVARPNEVLNTVIGRWMALAKQEAYKELLMDVAEKSYTEKHLKKVKLLYQVAANMGKPKSFDRYLVMAKACLTHDAYEELPKIQVPTLVVGGCEDRVLSGEGSREVASQIPGSQLIMYDGLGHGLYEEAEDFAERVMEFIL